MRPDLYCQRLAPAAAWETDCPGIGRGSADGGKRYVEWTEACRVPSIFPIHRMCSDVIPLLKQAQKGRGDAPQSLCSTVVTLQQAKSHRGLSREAAGKLLSPPFI